ncbi:hypothetical protein SAMN04487981_12952 [Streptomyces sp. cf386]|uniref:hypothetical protein n=1 Tax=Streptomyces sp. cf386 TaxID=1761904 RepID=UPI00087FF823|nr:hypothetical protein [Streptomyces sp. cf386]SDP62411.1 hypothetical protein SAMN04487981_12952 [Streptomyces sp. cf386]
MTVNDLLALLVVITALRVFLPDLHAGLRTLLRAIARVGVAELLQTQTARPAPDPAPAAVTSRDGEG